MARVFVGIPTVNRPDYVQETIASVLGQTFADIRVVVSDDASEGDVADRVEGWIGGLGDPRVSFHRHTDVLGEYGQGWFFMRSVEDEEYFTILHDDDFMEPTYIERAVRQMDTDCSLAYFVANPQITDSAGHVSEEATRNYLTIHGRPYRGEGVINVLDTLFGVRPGSLRGGLTPRGAGFTPISGTFFRTAALRDSGFADEPGVRNYPFEFDLLLRIAEGGGRAWFCPESLLRFRHHGGSLTNNMALLDNPVMLGHVIGLLERRRFSGGAERFRRVLLARYLRAQAIIALKSKRRGEARRSLVRALKENPFSPRGWLTVPGAFVAPWAARAILPPLKEARFRAGWASDVVDEGAAGEGVGGAMVVSPRACGDDRTHAGRT